MSVDGRQERREDQPALHVRLGAHGPKPLGRARLILQAHVRWRLQGDNRHAAQRGLRAQEHGLADPVAEDDGPSGHP